MDESTQSVLDAAGLTGRKALALDAAGAGTALVVDVSRDEMLDRWAAARDAVHRTGRWPVLCQRTEAHDGEIFSRFYFEEGADGADSGPAAVLARAETIDVDARMADLLRGQLGNDDAERTVERHRSRTLADYGDAPPAARIRAAVGGDEPAPIAVERHLFEWERTHEPVHEPDAGVQDWFGREDDPALVLLPVARPWAVYAYVHTLYDACWYGHDLLVAAARRWYERYGAEPVAALEVTSWLRVTRPPGSPDDAWRLAVEHHAVAESTFVTPDVALRQHARLLPHRNRWVLFSRP
ncbi:DUF4253 domain-containing protein [Micromonospora sp. NPDC049559]|uniref:DUF4253 domain-containing protein n=1 Tax=Micromonospora sp. NPDC049559 TaxID=3155923 RepID=UPI003441DB85